ncbi:MAG: HDOD domain-containing protein [Opitutaceae bacterium]
MTIEIEQILKDLRALPVAPQVLPRLQTLLGNLNTDTGDLVDLIKLDSGLASKVLRLSNSAFFSRGREVTAIDEAIGLIGYQETFRVVAHSSYSTFMNRPLLVYGLKPGALWDDAVVCAFAMEELSRRIGEDVNDGYSIGLLHGIGMVAVNDFLERNRKEGEPLPDFSRTTNPSRREIALIGMDHGEIGAALLRRWGFPESITEPISHRFSPMLCLDRQKTAYALNLACELTLAIRAVAEAPPAGDEQAAVHQEWNPHPEQLEFVELDREAIAETMETVSAKWADARAFLN